MKKRGDSRGLLILLTAGVSLLMAALISLSFANAQISSTQIEFTTGTMYCDNASASASWVNSTSGERFLVPSVKRCDAYSHPDVPSCCPTGLACNTSSGSCYIPSRITECTSYNNLSSNSSANKRACEADDVGVGITSVGDSSNCGLSPYFFRGAALCINQTTCGCAWVNNHCVAQKNYTTRCPPNVMIDLGACTWSASAQTTNCTFSNVRTIVSTGTWAGGVNAQGKAECDAGITRTYPCVAVARLDFASNFGIILSALLIIGIYGYLALRNKK